MRTHWLGSPSLNPLVYLKPRSGGRGFAAGAVVGGVAGALLGGPIGAAIGARHRHGGRRGGRGAPRQCRWFLPAEEAEAPVAQTTCLEDTRGNRETRRRRVEDLLTRVPRRRGRRRQARLVTNPCGLLAWIDPATDLR